MTVECIRCKKAIEIGIDQSQYDAFLESGKFVQDYFPNMPAPIREMLISQICDSCWNKLFQDDYDPYA